MAAHEAPDETRRTRADKTTHSYFARCVVAWVMLVIAGLLETGWAVGLKHSEGFTRPLPTVLTVLGIVASMGLLSWSVRTLPLGTAYATWVGIGTAGTVIVGMLFLGESTSVARVGFLVLLLVAVAGLKVVE